MELYLHSFIAFTLVLTVAVWLIAIASFILNTIIIVFIVDTSAIGTKVIKDPSIAKDNPFVAIRNLLDFIRTVHSNVDLHHLNLNQSLVD